MRKGMRRCSWFSFSFSSSFIFIFIFVLFFRISSGEVFVVVVVAFLFCDGDSFFFPFFSIIGEDFLLFGWLVGW